MIIIPWYSNIRTRISKEFSEWHSPEIPRPLQAFEDDKLETHRHTHVGRNHSLNKQSVNLWIWILWKNLLRSSTITVLRIYLLLLCIIIRLLDLNSPPLALAFCAVLCVFVCSSDNSCVCLRVHVPLMRSVRCVENLSQKTISHFTDLALIPLSLTFILFKNSDSVFVLYR